MNFKKKSPAIQLLTGALTLCIIFGTVFVGVYPVAAASNQTASKPPVSGNKGSTQGGVGTHSEDYASQAERYYKADSLPLFGIVFSRLDESAQKAWLEKLYADGDFAFFSTAVRGLAADTPLIAEFAEKAYVDEEMAFFSTLTDCMDETELELWLDRTLDDGNWTFQSILFDKLGRGDEFDKLEEKQEKEWAEAQMAEYQTVGVTMDGKDYYYQGQLVNIFMDIRKGGAFYALNMNPKGTVNIKIVRDADDKIAGVAYMTETEVAELLGDMADSDDDWTDDQQITIPIEIDSVKNGEYIWLGTYDLSEDDCIYYHISAETGQQLVVGFAKPGQKRPNPTYNTISNLRQNDEKLEINSGAIVWGVKSGEYSLFIHTKGGTLMGITGYVTIVKANAD